jgi:hypothetical protein
MKCSTSIRSRAGIRESCASASHDTGTEHARHFWCIISGVMRYLVKARVKSGQEPALVQAIDEGTLGQGSIAGDEYLEDMEHARFGSDGAVIWVEVCFCATPLAEERPYWEKYFDLLSVKDAHSRKNCRDLNGTEPWACSNCDCTSQLEERLAQKGEAFLGRLRSFRCEMPAVDFS